MIYICLQHSFGGWRLVAAAVHVYAKRVDCQGWEEACSLTHLRIVIYIYNHVHVLFIYSFGGWRLATAAVHVPPKRQNYGGGKGLNCHRLQQNTTSLKLVERRAI